MRRRFYVVIGLSGWSIGRRPLVRRERRDEWSLLVGSYQEGSA